MGLKKTMLMAAAVLGMAQAAESEKIYSYRAGNRRYNHGPVFKKNERYQKMVGRASREDHEFCVHGEIIMAPDRKTALKIYARRHGQ